MKVLLTCALLIATAAYAAEKEAPKKLKHDKEHQHNEAAADHEHDEAHHKDHDHKSHHPSHDEDTKKKKQ